MSDFDVHPDEMRFRPLPDDDLEGVSAFVEELRDVYGAATAPAPNQALASLLASGLTTDHGERRRRMRMDLVGTRRGKIGVALAAAFAAFSGFGVAGALPGTVQNTVSDAGTHIGLHLPSDNDDQGQDFKSQGTDVESEIEAPETTEPPEATEPTEVENDDQNETPEPTDVEVDNDAQDEAPEAPEATEVGNDDHDEAPEPADVEDDDHTTTQPTSTPSNDESSGESPESSND